VRLAFRQAEPAGGIVGLLRVLRDVLEARHLEGHEVERNRAAGSRDRETSGRAVAILLDAQGPAIRTGEVDSKLPLRIGDILEFTLRGAKPKETNSVSVNYDAFIDDVSVGDKVLVDNGVIQLRVLGKGEDRVRCKVLTAATLSSRRHINLPGVDVKLPPITGKDLKDIALGAELGVDFVALSFARQKSDLEELRRARDEGSRLQRDARGHRARCR
jgi:pyruvate kinase